MTLKDNGELNFVGRSYEIEAANTFFDDLLISDIRTPPRFFVIYGEGGLGKSKLAAKLAISLGASGIQTTQVIDLKTTNNRSLLSLLRKISDSLGPSNFDAFHVFSEKYEQSSDLNRNLLYSNALKAFLRAMECVTVDSPAVIILDTIETIEDTKYSQTLYELLQQFNGRCGFVLAGKIIPALSNVIVKSYKIGSFLKSDIEAMTINMYRTRGRIFTLNPSVFDKLLYLTDGKPILCALAIDWFMENEDQVSYVLSLKKEVFEREVTNCIKRLERIEVEFIEMMAIFTKRFNSIIASYISGVGEPECDKVLEQLKRFSFVKYGADDREISLHDEIVGLIRKMIPLSKVRLLINKIIGWYLSCCDETIVDGSNKILVAELLHYKLASGVDENIQWCDLQMQLAIESYDYEWWNLLYNETSVFTGKSIKLKNIIEISRAEMLITQYRPKEARLILESILPCIDKTNDNEMYGRILEGFGNSIINPCTIEGADLFKAIEYFKQSIEIYERNKILGRIPICLLELGKAYQCIGRGLDAETSFQKALEISDGNQTFKLSAKVLDEMGKMYRLQQKVEESLCPLNKSYKLRQQMKDEKNLGVYHYYLANTYRDLDDFYNAEIQYAIAEGYLQDNDDKFKLCELYCDKSWMNCLSSEWTNADILLEKAWELALNYQFGTEFSEYYHIKYEICVANDNYPLAYEYLDKALCDAKKFSNIYIILDCLNHVAQRAYAQKNYDQLPSIIKEMEAYENLGCGIKVFTGRAKMVMGDYFFEQKEFSQAFELWVEGLITIALYGNSRSNIEVFTDILGSRRYHLQQTLKQVGESFRQLLIDKWNSHNLAISFPDVIDICNLKEE